MTLMALVSLNWKISQNLNVKKKMNEIFVIGAIHWAADRGNHRILEILLQNGANVNLIDKDSGQTALHYAISCSHLECIKVLLKFGANPNITDSDDVTCIDLANESEDPNIIELLRT